MRHRKKSFTLSRTAGKRRALVRTLAISFVTRGSIRTSPAKGRFVQQFVEPLVTVARRGDLSSRRRVLQALANRTAAAALVTRAQTYRDRPGGYTRLTKLPTPRAGDHAPRVLLEWV